MRGAVVDLLSRPDEVMLEIGAGGELLVARLRVVVAALLLLLPLANAASGGAINETLIGLAGAIFVNIFAQVWLALARSKRRYPWLTFATGAYDVSATTLTLLLLMANHLPSGLNSLIVWCGYLLSIQLTALRNDGRVTLFVGALALLQYGLLVAGVFAFVQTPEQLVSVEYGTVEPANQIQRLVLLAVATLMTAAVVYRMQRLVRLSGSDGLTGLPNRTWLIHRAPRLLETAKLEGETLTLALIDLDHFKRINDEVGHLAGDRALKHVVGVIEEQLEDREWLVRLGGEEFVLLMRKPIGRGWERVEQMRGAVALRPFLPGVDTPARPVTFSAGLSCFPNEGADLSALLRRADARLQIAKRSGRNRVVARDE